MLVYTIVGRFIFWIITSIIWGIFLKDRKLKINKKEKKLKGKKEKIVNKKEDITKGTKAPRIFGLLFGTCRGLIDVTLTVSLIKSVFSTGKSAK